MFPLNVKTKVFTKCFPYFQNIYTVKNQMSYVFNLLLTYITVLTYWTIPFALNSSCCIKYYLKVCSWILLVSSLPLIWFYRGIYIPSQLCLLFWTQYLIYFGSKEFVILFFFYFRVEIFSALVILSWVRIIFGKRYNRIIKFVFVFFKNILNNLLFT